jgi:Ni/Co efflux regulator RcnB
MRLIATSLAAGLIAFSAVAPAFADQRGRGHGDRRGHDRDYRDGRRDDWRRDNHRRDDRRHHRGWYDSRGAHHYWKKGDYFSYRPRQSSYVVVHDYNRYRLPPPRHGQYYYRDSNTGEILLIAAATGLVLWALTQ